MKKMENLGNRSYLLFYTKWNVKHNLCSFWIHQIQSATTTPI